jgi:hypothetical protein
MLIFVIRGDPMGGGLRKSVTMQEVKPDQIRGAHCTAPAYVVREKLSVSRGMGQV